MQQLLPLDIAEKIAAIPPAKAAFSIVKENLDHG